MKQPRISANFFLPMAFSRAERERGFCSKASKPASVAVVAAASGSVKVRRPRPATSFRPGTDSPALSWAEAHSSRSFTQAAKSLPFSKISAISSGASSGAFLNSSCARARLPSARARQIAFARHHRQCSPGLNSPSPESAALAAGTTSVAAHASRSARSISAVE